MVRLIVFAIFLYLLRCVYGSSKDKLFIVVLHSNGYLASTRSSSHLRSYQFNKAFKATTIKLHDSLLSRVNGRKIHSYTVLVNGFSASLTEKQAEELNNMPEVLFVAPDKLRKKTTTRSFEFLGLNNKTGGIWRKSTGTNAIIGMIDTGVWPQLASFSGAGFGSPPKKFKGTCDFGSASFSCNNKLIGARYFGDNFAAANYPGFSLQDVVSSCNDFLSPRDIDGHGSHTASTAGGGIVSSASLNGVNFGSPHGVAYGARIVAYKVFWCNKGAQTSDIILAMEAGISDGVDVLSLSLGDGPITSSSSNQDPMFLAAYQATLENVAVVFAGGNDGPNWFTIDNSVPWVLTVAASSIDRNFPMTAVLGNKQKIQGVSVANPGTSGFAKNVMYPIIFGVSAAASQSLKSAAGYCTSGSLDSSLVTGKIVVCSYKSGSHPLDTVYAAGGVAAIIYFSSASGDALIGAVINFPYMAISYDVAQTIRKYIASTTNPTALLQQSTVVVGASNVEAPLIAPFSSRGPNGASFNILKPDISAPGLNILAAYSPYISGVSWGIESGTSMATPHVSGVIAILKSYYPSWTPSMCFSAIQTTAKTITNRGRPISSSPFSMGSGELNPNAAIDPGLVYAIPNSGYDVFMCSPDSGLSKKNSTAYCKSYPSTRAVDLNIPSISFYAVKLGKTSSTVRVLQNVGPASTYTVSIQSPSGSALSVSPRKLVFKKGQALSYSVTVKPSAKSANVRGALSTVSASSPKTVKANLQWTFGSITWSDNLGHSVRIPVVLNTV